MKRQIFLMLCPLFLLLSSCHKCEVAEYLGDYSFKTSGKVSATGVGTSVNYTLPEKIGTMHVMKSGDGEHDVMITMNEVGGAVYTMYGDVEDGALTIASYEKELDLKLLSLIGEPLTVKVSGTGEIHDDVLVLTQSYWGRKEDMLISGHDILTVAERNE